MVDIQSATDEIRRGIKKDRRNKPQGKNIMHLLRRAAINRELQNRQQENITVTYTQKTEIIKLSSSDEIVMRSY